MFWLYFPQLAVLAGWCVAIVINMTVVYGLYEYSNGKPMSTDVNILYISVSRFAWSVGLAWVTLACITGYGGEYCYNIVINKGKEVR